MFLMSTEKGRAVFCESTKENVPWLLTFPVNAIRQYINCNNILALDKCTEQHGDIDNVVNKVNSFIKKSYDYA